MPPDELIGASLGNYSIIRPIGQGGMAAVFLARDERLQRDVAIKVFQPRSNDNETFLRRFAREARVVARLDHPNILTVYDYGEQNGNAYFVMPYLAHGSLRERLQQEHVLPISDALTIIVQILHALQYAHERNFIHRDIKPGNILFKDQQTPVLSDFGLVKFIQGNDISSPFVSTEITHTGDIGVMGTPQYMAPEQIQGHPSQASDIYSVGVVLYEMLTGAPPFTAENTIMVLSKHLYEQPRPLVALNPSVTPELNQAVLRALAKNESDRYATPSDFIAALEEAARKNQLPHIVPDWVVAPPTSEVKMDAGSLTITPGANAPDYRTVYHPESLDDKRINLEEQPTISIVPTSVAVKKRHLSHVRIFIIAACIALLLFFVTSAWYVKTQSDLPLMTQSTSIATKQVASTKKGSPGAATLPNYDTSCPGSGLVRKPILLNLLNRGSNPELVYYSHIYVPDSHEFSGSLGLYSASDGKKTTLLASNTFSIDQAVLSPDKQWILFSTSTAGQPAKLQMLRIDGKGLQTLYCASKNVQISQLSWSPFDEIEVGRVFFETTSLLDEQSPSPAPIQTLAYQLDVQNGKLIQEKTTPQNSNWGIPIGWADSRSIYLQGADNSLYLYELSMNGELSQMNMVHQATGCDSYAQNTSSYDPTMFVGHCNGMGNGGCDSQNCGNSGPSTIADLNSKFVPYTNKDLAIVGINYIGNYQFIALVKNIQAGRDSPDNGLYLIDRDGRLTSIHKDNGDGLIFSFSSRSELDDFCGAVDHCSYYVVRTRMAQAAGENHLFLGTTDGKSLIEIAHSQRDSLDIAGWTQL